MSHSGDLLESVSSEGCEGYDEYFAPPLEKKYECSICLLGLREPVQTSCGHRFCRGCILRSISDAGQKCPVDNEHLEDWQLNPDNFARREVLNHPVFCRLSKLYQCPWKGPLGKLEDHSEECDFVHIFCPKSCGKEFLRKDLKKHLEDECPNRTISCTFCGEEVSWNSLENHFQDCRQYLLSFEKCRTELTTRGASWWMILKIVLQMQDHNEKECPTAELKCPFSVVGCQFEGPRPAVDEHVNDNMFSHLAGLAKECGQWKYDQPSLQALKSRPGRTRDGVEAQEQASQDVPLVNLATLCQQQQTEIDQMRDLVKCMGGMIECLAYEHCMRLNNLESSRQQQIMEIGGFLNELRTRVEQELIIRCNRHEARTYELEGRVCNGTYTWRIENYEQHRQAAIIGSETCIISPPFYTSLNGYKLCLRINLNGVDSGVGRYIALFVHMMQGDYDSILEWPFTGRITLTILDQSDGTEFRQHISESLIAEPNHSASQRPTSPVNQDGYSCVAIAPIERIREPQYINNNTLLVRIQIDL